MKDVIIEPKVKKPLFLTFDEAQHALGWTDSQMAAIGPLGGFMSKAHERRFKAGIGRTYTINFGQIDSDIKKKFPQRQPFLDEAIAMAQKRFALIDEAGSANV